MRPCDVPLMSNVAWRRFLGGHPHWRAPQIAPCSLGAARSWLKKVATISGGATAGATGVAGGVHHFAHAMVAGPANAALPPISAIPTDAVSVPEPSSLVIFATGLVLLGVVLTVRTRALGRESRTVQALPCRDPHDSAQADAAEGSANFA